MRSRWTVRQEGMSLRQPVVARGPQRAVEQQSRCPRPPSLPGRDPDCVLCLRFSRPTSLCPVSTSLAPVSNLLVPSLNQTRSFPDEESPSPAPRDEAPSVGLVWRCRAGDARRVARGPRRQPATRVPLCPAAPHGWPGERTPALGLAHAPSLHLNLLFLPSPPTAHSRQRKVTVTSFYLL